MYFLFSFELQIWDFYPDKQEVTLIFFPKKKNISEKECYCLKKQTDICSMELKVKQRIAIGTCFFLTGVCFATWASRIPTIKDFFLLNEAELGNLLMVMPITAVIGLPVSGWMVSKYNTRGPLLSSFFLALLF